MTDRTSSSNAALWIALLTLASFVATWAVACRIPYAALAVLAAVTMRRRDGIAMLLLVWATSQIVGLLMLHWPHDGATLAWGLATGLGAIVAMEAARLAIAPIRTLVLRAAAGLVAAYVAFKAVIAAFSLVLGGTAKLVAPALLLRQFPREAAFLAGLLLAYALLTRLGVPSAGGRRLQAA